MTGCKLCGAALAYPGATFCGAACCAMYEGGARASLWELRSREGTMLAWLQARPSYCDRGRWVLGVEASFRRSDADPSPRYYFDLEAAKHETLAYLAAKKINLTGAAWRPVVRP